MRIYNCDRCMRKFAESGPDDPPQDPKDPSIDNGITIRLPVVIGENSEQVVLREFDLCPNCIRDFDSWMKNDLKRGD